MCLCTSRLDYAINGPKMVMLLGLAGPTDPKNMPMLDSKQAKLKGSMG